MARPKREIKEKSAGFSFNKLKEVWGLSLLLLSVFFLLSFLTYQDNDVTGLSLSNSSVVPRNFFGITGAYCAYYPLTYLGFGAYFIPFSLFLWALRAMFTGFSIGIVRCYVKTMLFCVTILSVCILSTLIAPSVPGEIKNLVPSKYFGGLAGDFVVGKYAVVYLGYRGSIVIFSFLIVLFTLLLTDGRPIVALRWIGNRLFDLFVVFYNSAVTVISYIHSEVTKERIKSPKKVKNKKVVIRKVPQKVFDDFFDDKPNIPVETKIVESKSVHADNFVKRDSNIPEESYHLPAIRLLEKVKQPKSSDINASLNKKATLLRHTLMEFGIEVTVSGVTRGPVITMYELTLAPGVKVQRITALEDDIALAMKSQSIRIVAPIPGKAAVGIEVPNDVKSLVTLRELLCSKEFAESRAELPIVLGKDITGNPIIADLTSAPHLLIAGATGSGKSVCINTIIISLLYSCSPNRLRFLMVDPKKVELAPYNDLPHMITKVITNPKKAHNGLNWAVHEMEDRYQILADAGVRNIKSFNKLPYEKRLLVTVKKEFHKAVMPYIVVILDELADLMMVARADIEDSITRLAQLSRAVGIHLIVATQRPSVNVITGVIKANFPVRIAFNVSSKVDSRTVLDANGAEAMLGNGDFLFLPPGTARLIRGQGAYVSDKGINSVIDFVSSQNVEEDNRDIFGQEDLFAVPEEAEDELYDKAVEEVMLSRQASSSYLQRKLRVGYARAARLIDIMEANGVVGPQRGSKPREILIDN